MVMQLFMLILSGFLLTKSCLGLAATSPLLEAKGGVLDLSSWDQKALPRLVLKGEWQYHWDRLDDEDALKQGLWLLDPPSGLVPSGTAWSKIKPGETADFGAITYVLRITGLKQQTENLGLVFGQFMNAHRAYVFDPKTGQLTRLSTVGQVSRFPEGSIPQLRKVIAPLPAVSGDDLWLIIQASSYLVPGGFHFPPEMASWTFIQEHESRTAYETFWILGMFSLLFVSNLSLFILRRDDHASFMMSLFSLVMGLRYASTEAVLSMYFPEPSLMAYALSSSFIASALPIGLCLYLHFFYSTFPGHYPRKALISAYALAAFHLGLNATTLFMPNWPHLDTQIMALLLILAGLLIFKLLRLTWRGENGAGLSLLGFCILLVTMSNDVLVFMNFYSFPYVGHYGMLAFIFSQSLVVASNFAIAFRTARHLSRSLQKEVDRQTRDVKSILKNIHQGIFTIRSGFVLGDDYSPFLEDILGTTQIAGQPVLDILFARGNLTQEQLDMLRSILETSLNEPLINFEVNAQHLVRDMTFKDAQDREKALLVEWDPVTDPTGNIEKILVTLRDVTELKLMEQKNSQNQRDMELIAEIIEVASDRFQQFLVSSRRFLDENARLLLSQKFSDQDLKILFINYHTMKGAARTYRFLGMTNIIHEAEHFIAMVQRGQVAWDRQRALEDLGTVRTVFADYERVNREKLKRDDNYDFVRLELETVRENIKALESIGEIRLDDRLTPFVDRVRRTFFQLYFQDLKLILTKSERHLEQLARDLNKATPRLVVESIPVGVTKEAAELLHDILIHIYRNIMDHGIESPDERVRRGKPEAGTITVLMSLEAKQELRIRFRDDGQGIQLDKIAAIGRSRKLLRQDTTPEPHKVANLIFLPGFSTADAVTEISGRGVGMTAIREYLEQAGGRVEISILEETSTLRAVAFALDVYLPATQYSILPEDEDAAA